MAAKQTVSLPPPAELERTCKGLAALDAILCDDWESRYYSFNQAWNKKGKQRMASMRNGEGDDWFIVFGPAGVFVKSFWHEYPPQDVAKLYAGLPKPLAPQLEEAAFSMEDVTFGGWNDGEGWTLRGNAKPLAADLALLAGDAKKYVAYAAAYFDIKAAPDAVAHVLAGKKLDSKLLTRLGSERMLADLESDLREIGY
jgi:hypothetical protein